MVACGILEIFMTRKVPGDDDGIVACGILGIFITRKVPGSLSKVSCGSIKPTKMIAEQENKFG